jgi:hypothetical protein
MGRSPSDSTDRKYYEAMQPSTIAERLGIRARDQIYDDFISLYQPHLLDAILDVGVSDVLGSAANVLERRYSCGRC